jgi:uncharacterized membrane protein
MNDTETYTGAVLAGAVAGMRSMTAPALVSHLAASGALASPHASLRLLSSPLTAKVASVLAIGEAVADKLPFVPSRILPGPLVTRAVTGGISGAAVVSSKRGSALLGAIIGAATAVGASYAAYKLRKEAGRRLHLPDSVVALAEDAVVAGACYLAVRRLRASGVNL